MMTIPRGRTSGTIVIQTIADGQANETLIVALSEPPSGSTLGTVQLEPGESSKDTMISAAGTVTVSVAAATPTVNEGDTAQFTLTLSEPATNNVDVDVAYGTVGLSDTEVRPPVRIPVGSSSVRFSVTTPEDTQAKEDSRFSVMLSDASDGVELGTATATVTILDDDPLSVSVRSLERTVVEGGTGSGSPDPTANATFEVKLDGGTGGADVTVTYALSGTATGATDTTEDYTEPSGSVEIVAGATTGTITVVTNDDEVLEGDETVTVTLTHASTTAGTVRLGTPTTASTTINDSVSAVTVELEEVDGTAANDDATVTEGEAQTFTVTLSGPVSVDVVVGYATANGTATTADYSRSASGTVTILSDSVMATTITVPTLEDTLAENTETFTVTLSGSGLPANVSIRQATAEATIKDDDPLTVSLVGPKNVTVGDDAVYTVMLKGGTSSAVVVVPYAVTVGGESTNQTLTIAAGRTKGTIVVPTAGQSGTLTVALAVPDEETTTGTVGLEPGESSKDTMISAAGTVTVSVAATTPTVNEGDTARFTLTLSAAANNDVSVGYRTQDLSTPEIGGTVTIQGGRTSATFTVDTPEDTKAEADATFTVTLGTLTSEVETGTATVVALGTDTATVTILDDDPLSVSVRSLERTVVEGGTGGINQDPTANATFEVKLDGGTGGADVTVMYALSGTATGATDTTEDYTEPSGSVEIVAGATTGTITVVTNDDEVLEGDETVTVTLTHASTTAGTVRLGTPTTASTTINDSDSAVTVELEEVDGTAANDDATVTEGEAQTFTVTLSGPVSVDVVVGYATANGTATTADYSRSASGTVTILSDSVMATITVPTLEDTLAENTETFTVTLSGSGLPANVSIRQATAEATIKDDDPLTVSLVGPENVTVGDDAVYTVMLKGGTSSAVVVVPYAVTVGGESTNQTLTIAAGRTKGTIVVPTAGQSGTLTVPLAVPDEETTTGTVGLEPRESSKDTMISAAGTVTVSVAATTPTVNEGDTARFTLTLSAAANNDVSVGYRDARP